MLLTAEEYQNITKTEKKLVEALAMPEAAAIPFEPLRLKGKYVTS